MPKYLKQSSKLQNNQSRPGRGSDGKYLKQNNPAAEKSNPPQLVQIRKRVAMQAGLAVLTIILTVIIIFAMSAAWYTNIVQTNGLVFQVKEWGFDGEITTNTEPILAGPGDDGLISLIVESKSDDISSVSVSVTKTKMDSQIQKRLYFYVDAKVDRNGETVERIYLNSQDSYTYTLFSQGVLTLTDTIHNDNQLKWHWVYDVLGYYVLGSKTSDGDVIVTEYLRPIEYDYDSATMAYVTDDDGNITGMEMETVDGTTKLEDFLVKLSRSDGYAGVINPQNQLESGYYPVDVDEYGNGVYAYLCSYADIEMATQYDTELGEAAAKGVAGTYEATLTISAQKNKNSVINVTSLAGLNTAMTSTVADVIQLSSEITIGEDESLVIADGQQVMLDLNGYQIISETSEVPIVVEEGGSLTMINGAITTELEETTYAINAVGAELVLSNVELTGFSSALKVMDDSSTEATDSIVRLVSCTLETDSNAIVVFGNGSDSAQPTQLIIEDSEIVSNGIAISGNGSVANGGKYGTDIQILNSTITSSADNVAVGIYHPQKDSTLTIYNSTVSGYTGVSIKGGSVYVIGSTINGMGQKQVPEAFSGSGCADTGDAIYIETNYEYEIQLEITENSILTSTYSYALQVYESDARTVKVKIYSGVFNRLPDGTATLFKSYVDSGSAIDQTIYADGTYSCTVTVPATEN